MGGAHVRGSPHNGQLTDRAGRLVASTQTAPAYRLFALDTVPPKPGLVRAGADAHGAACGDFVAQGPAPMCIGRVVLADGDEVAGFLCEPFAIEGAAEITSYGGWRAFRS